MSVGIASHTVQHLEHPSFEGLVLGGGELWILLEQLEGLLLGQLHLLQVAGEVGQLELGQAVLPGAKKVPRTPMRQVKLGDLEAVVGGAEHLQPGEGLRGLGI